MAHESKELLKQIMAFEIDDDQPAFSFAQRLARENRWTREYADRVVIEYKRFLFLVCTAGHPVTPSDQVDQAWHLHLTYTRSYWDRLCSQTLERPIHHEPTRGGSEEDAKYHGYYDQTLASYTRHFGEHPTDIWPDAHARFAPPEPVSSQSDSGITRLPWRPSRLLQGALALLGIVMSIALLKGTANSSEPGGVTRAGAAGALIGVGFMFGIMIIGYALARDDDGKKDRKNRRGTGAGGAAGGAACTALGGHHDSGNCGGDSSGGCSSGSGSGCSSGGGCGSS